MAKTEAVKVAGYVRVSTSQQAKEGYSLGAQEVQIKSYIEKEGGRKLVKIYQDVMSGTKADRPALNSLMRDAEAGIFQEVVVIAFDRFGRSTQDLLLNVSKLKELKVNFVSLREKIDLNTAVGKFFLTVLAAIAELEIAIKKERVEDVRAERLKEGKLVGGQVPFGFERGKNGEIVRNEEQIEAYLKIVELCLEGKSNDKIAEFLNDRGYETKKSGMRWHSSVVSKILRNRAYCDGFFMINKWVWDAKKGGWKQRPESEQEKCSLGEPVISKETFSAIRKSVESRTAGRGRATKRWMLAGLLKCTCGAFFTSQESKWGRYYRCNNRCASACRRTTSQKCMMPLLDAGIVEEKVWSRIKEYVTEPGLILEELSGKAEKDKLRERLETEIDSLSSQFEKVKSSQLKLSRKFTGGKMEEDIFDVQYKELRSQRERIETELLLKGQELKLLETEVVEMEEFKEGKDILERVSEGLKVKLDSLEDVDKKRKLITAFYNRAAGEHILVELGDEGFKKIRQFKPTRRSSELVFLVAIGAYNPLRVVKVLREIGLLAETPSYRKQSQSARTISPT